MYIRRALSIRLRRCWNSSSATLTINLLIVLYKLEDEIIYLISDWMQAHLGNRIIESFWYRYDRDSHLTTGEFRVQKGNTTLISCLTSMMSSLSMDRTNYPKEQQQSPWESFPVSCFGSSWWQYHYYLSKSTALLYQGQLNKQSSCHNQRQRNNNGNGVPVDDHGRDHSHPPRYSTVKKTSAKTREVVVVADPPNNSNLNKKNNPSRTHDSMPWPGNSCSHS